MQALLAPLRELAEYETIRQNIQKKSGSVLALSGCVDSQKLHMIYGLGDGKRCRVIITFNDLKAKELYEEYKFYDRNVTLYPAKDLIFFQADIHGNQLTRERIITLRRLVEKKLVTVITTFAALMTPQVLWDNDKDVISIERGGILQENRLCEQLVSMGYEKCYQVESPGQFSVRGGIVDVFDLTEENPYRIELWGDEVDSIRSFDILSQRSIEKLESIRIYPATEFVLSKEQIRQGLEWIEREAKDQEQRFRDAHDPEAAHRIAVQVKELREQLTEFQDKVNLESYVRYFYQDTVTLPELLRQMGSEPVFFIDEPARVKEQADAVEFEFSQSMEQRMLKGYILPGQMKLLYTGEQTAAKMRESSVVTLSTLSATCDLLKPDKKYDIGVRNVAPYNNSFETLVKDLKNYHKKGYRVLLLSGSRTRAKRLAEDLRDNELTAVYSEDPMREVLAGEVLTCYGHVSRGFEYPMLKFVVLSETDIFGAEKKKKKKKKQYQGQKINDFNELKVGDYVVHESHGLGIYKGIEKVEMEHVVKDYIKIEYRDGGNLYVLATGLDVLQKYASADAKKPKLNKLGGNEWKKTKERVNTAVEGVAKRLVELYSVRQQSKGYEFSPDTVWQREFEELFPYEETEDQDLAIEAVKRDMESTKIMDRLICGDVGFGKTEVAIRAAFKAVQEGKQVAYLAPTTILAEQHYNTFTERMKNYPVNIGLLCRFRTEAEQKETVKDLKDGVVDIVIGTHKVLSKSIRYRDLGLLIIDEEHRFGVNHKEQIKALRNEIDVLTLTATPIPRTLNLSMTGIRDISTIETPPENRFPVQTFVMEYNDALVATALSRELARGGQAFVVSNRVLTMGSTLAHLQELLPDARIRMAHGQMPEAQLEETMMAFLNREIDILLCSTIIESGVDIPNANTLVVLEADKLGLAQLYQLRGRVGRSTRMAYAYLTVPQARAVSETAQKRLLAIREFTQFGAGFRLAMRDLEIRGAGSLLGAEQHGHIADVGYEFYCKMMRSAVAEAKGEEIEPEIELGSHNLLISLARIGLGVACVTEEFVSGVEERFFSRACLAAPSARRWRESSISLRRA